MSGFDFNNKKFSLVENSELGTVNAETTFLYAQSGDLVTADYYGGNIRYGKIIARLADDQLHMLYQCLTTDNELKAGRALAQINLVRGKIKLSLNWEWLGDKPGKGISEYIEH